MKIGICGYGNLGKAVEKEIYKADNNELVAIFSRRKNVSSPYNTLVEDYLNAPYYKEEIDTMIMCGGSQEDLEWQSPDLLRYFNIIDTFDTHSRIEEHRKKLNEISKISGKTAIYSCGWDPGLFSLMRSVLSNVFDKQCYTFWGKGVSQGHSEALRNIDGIADAIQFTIPNEGIKQKAYTQTNLSINSLDMHERHCYICLDGSRSLEDVERDILNTKNYFKGQKVIINEVSYEEIQKLKQHMYHEGEVICANDGLEGSFHLKMENNPTMTAKILLAYLPAIKKMPTGVYSLLDIPTNYIGKEDNHRFL